MDVIRTLWPNVASGFDHAKEIIFKNDIVTQVLSARSTEALVARSEPGPAIQFLIVLFVWIQIAIVLFIFITIGYTMYEVFPVLAIVEDDAPESYEPLANKDAVDLEESDENKAAHIDEGLAPRSKPVTSSLRATYRLLRSIGGRRSLFRGLVCRSALRFAVVMTTFILSRVPFIPTAVAWPIASLLALPLYIAWTHIVITGTGGDRFWCRIPPFGLSFRAAGRPALGYFVLTGCEDYIITTVISASLGWKSSSNSFLAWFLYMALAFLLWVFVMLPIHAILIRVQASLLPEEERTIVPLNRSITLHRAEGKEYLSMVDAWKSFSRATWTRLFKLYAKVFGLSLAVESVIAVVAFAEFLVINTIMGRP